MLAEIAADVQTELTLRGCPLAVVYGPETHQDVSLVRSRVVIERPREMSDAVVPPRAARLNPPRRAERSIAIVMRIYAHSTRDGARIQDHEEMAEDAADLLVVAMQIAVARQSTTMLMGPCGYVPASAVALPELRAWPGVVYEMRATVQRGVFDRTWAGDAADEITDFRITTSGTCVSTVAPDP